MARASRPFTRKASNAVSVSTFQATAEPGQSDVDDVNAPLDGDVHNRVKRDIGYDPDGYGPNINVDMEINAGPNAHVAIDVDVNIGQ